MAGPKLLMAGRRRSASPARTGRAVERRRCGSARCSERWHPDPDEHAERRWPTGSALAADEGARMVCLQELTLSPYFAITPGRAGLRPAPRARGPRARTAPRHRFAASLAVRDGVYVHASLYERRRWPRTALGYNTAIVRRARRDAGGAHPQAAHPGHRRLLRGPLLPPRADGGDPFPSSRVGPERARSASRRAGTSGSRSSRAPTRWPAPRCSSTPRRSARSPTTRSSTPSRCGSR